MAFNSSAALEATVAELARLSQVDQDAILALLPPQHAKLLSRYLAELDPKSAKNFSAEVIHQARVGAGVGASAAISVEGRQLAGLDLALLTNGVLATALHGFSPLDREHVLKCLTHERASTIRKLLEGVLPAALNRSGEEIRKILAQTSAVQKPTEELLIDEPVSMPASSKSTIMQRVRAWMSIN